MVSVQVKIELMKVFPQNNTAVRSEDDGIERMIIKKENKSIDKQINSKIFLSSSHESQAEEIQRRKNMQTVKDQTKEKSFADTKMEQAKYSVPSNANVFAATRNEKPSEYTENDQEKYCFATKINQDKFSPSSHGKQLEVITKEGQNKNAEKTQNCVSWRLLSDKERKRPLTNLSKEESKVFRYNECPSSLIMKNIIEKRIQEVKRLRSYLS